MGEVAGLPRHIVSPGYDEAMSMLCARFPLRIHNFRSGREHSGWVVPPGWVCEEAFVVNGKGDCLLHTDSHPLCIASYSPPYDGYVDRVALSNAVIRNHRHPEEPPFLFYYYDRQWKFGAGYGFDEVLAADSSERFRVNIRSRDYEGNLKVAEWFLPGETGKEFIISTHLCHPYQVNDGLSGVITGLLLMQWLSGLERRRYSYRLLIGPETIGSVCWLDKHRSIARDALGGIFLEMTALPQRAALQRSWHTGSGSAMLNTTLEKAFRDFDQTGWVANYRGVVGNDERQFNGPNIRIPMLSYSRAHPWGHPHRPFQFYHSALDDMDHACRDAFMKSLEHLQFMFSALEQERIPNGSFRGEAFLSGLGLSMDRNLHLEVMRNRMKIMDMLDGSCSIAEIASSLHLPLEEVDIFIAALEKAGVVHSTSHSAW
jgi:aminopeptidase-like protein